MQKYHFFSLFSILLFLCACNGKNTNSNSNPQLKSLDLRSFNVPFTIQAPDSALVEREPIAIEEGISIRKGRFEVYVDIFRTLKEPQETAESIAQKEWEMTQKDTLFESVKLVKKERNGFIYEMKLPKLEKSYGFFYVIVKDSVLYEFHNLLEDNFTLEEAVIMYNAVKQ